MRKKPRIGVDVLGASAYYNDMVVDFAKRMHRLREVKKICRAFSDVAS